MEVKAILVMIAILGRADVGRKLLGALLRELPSPILLLHAESDNEEWWASDVEQIWFSDVAGIPRTSRTDTHPEL